MRNTYSHHLAAALARSAHLRAAFHHARMVATRRTRAAKVAEVRQVRDHLIAHLTGA